MAKALSLQSLAQNLAKELECAVCLGQYKEPKVLPCLHSYCKKCLEGLLKKQGVEWRINCPSCRISVKVSSWKILIQHNSAYFVVLRSSKGFDTCKMGGPSPAFCSCSELS